MQVVKRIYTDLAVIDVTKEGFVVREMVEDIDFDTLQARTEAKLHKASDLKPLKAPAASRPRGGRDIAWATPKLAAAALGSVVHIIQVALTPVFLLTGLAMLLNVFSTRLARVADQVDALAQAVRGRGRGDRGRLLSLRLTHLRRRSLGARLLPSRLARRAARIDLLHGPGAICRRGRRALPIGDRAVRLVRPGDRLHAGGDWRLLRWRCSWPASTSAPRSPAGKQAAEPE